MHTYQAKLPLQATKDDLQTVSFMALDFCHWSNAVILIRGWFFMTQSPKRNLLHDTMHYHHC